jgi:hypothetical protein
MPKVVNAMTTYNATANREDLSDAIYNIDPFDTPIMSAAGRRTVKNRSFDWQSENLPDVDENNAQQEGFELARTAAQPTVRLTNVAQISKRDATVSGSQEDSSAAGKGSEMAHQMALKSKVLKSDIEKIMSGRQARVNGDDSANPVPRRTEAVCHWIARAVDRFAVAGSAVVGYKAAGLPLTATDNYVAVAAGNQVAMTEILLGDAMQQAYNNGASPNLLVVPPSIKRTVSTFKGRAQSQIQVGRTEVVATVDVIQTDFGIIKVIPSRWIPTDVSLLLDPEYLAIGFFRNFRQAPIAKIGDAETRMILAEWGVEMRNPLAHMLFNGVKQGVVIGT